LQTKHGPLVTLPYTVELNDIPMMMVQHHTAQEFLARARDQFDRLYAEGEQRAKILCFAIHPYISGAPHRIKYLEAFIDYARGHKGVGFWTGEEILDWYRGTRDKG
jgi:allantoinase